jgi:hypothetical protein
MRPEPSAAKITIQHAAYLISSETAQTSVSAVRKCAQLNGFLQINEAGRFVLDREIVDKMRACYHATGYLWPIRSRWHRHMESDHNQVAA